MLALSVALVGCGDDDGEVPVDSGSGSDAGVIEDSGAVDAFVRGDAGMTVPWTVTVRNLVSGDRVSMATVCVADVPALPCATTDVEGNATLDVPVDLELQLRTTALRYFPTRTTYVSDTSERSVGVDLPPTTVLSVIGGRVDPEKGQLAFLAQDDSNDGVPGVMGMLAPMSGTGPRYTSGSLPDDELTATSSDGLGVFIDVDPGRVTLTYSGAECEPEEGWPSETGTLETLVEAGTLTIVIARCAVEVSDAGSDAGLDGGV